MAKEKILVVEDAPDISSLLKIYFTSQGYEVMVALRGQTALEICRKTPPNLALLDVNLPDMEGYDIGKALRWSARTRHIPIVFLTARGEKQDRLKGLGEVQAEYYLVKPFDIEEVHTVIKGALDRARQKNLTHPVTNLPTAELVNEQYRSLIPYKGWATALVTINGFETYTQAYGAVCGEDTMKFTASLLNEAVNELGTVDDFIGQLIVRPDFVITSLPEQLRMIVSLVTERFDAEVGLYYNFKDRRNGYIVVSDEKGDQRRAPLMSISIGVVTSNDGPFYDIRELHETMEEVRQRATVEAHLQGRKSYASYGKSDSISVGSAAANSLQPQSMPYKSMTVDQTREVLQSSIQQGDIAFLILHIKTMPDVARMLLRSGAIQFSHTQQVISFADNGVVAILAPSHIDRALDHLFDTFDTHWLSQKYGAKLWFGCVKGPFGSVDELVAAAANDLIERFPLEDETMVEQLAMFVLEPARVPLNRHHADVRQLRDSYQKSVEAQRLGVDHQIQASIDQLTAIVDHDLGSGLASLNAAIQQVLNQIKTSEVQERSDIEWLSRQVILCNAWKRSIKELGVSSLLQSRPANLRDWLSSRALPLAEQLSLEIQLDLGQVPRSPRVVVDPEPLLVAWLHTLLAARQAGSRSVRVTVHPNEACDQIVLAIEDSGDSPLRAMALRPDLPLTMYRELPREYQNLALVRRLLDQQRIDLSFQAVDAGFQIRWALPCLPRVMPPTIQALPKLRQEIARIEMQVADLKSQLQVPSDRSDPQSAEKLHQLLLPFVQGLLENLRSLAYASDLKQVKSGDMASIRRVQSLSFYCYLLGRNLFLALQGDVLPVERVDVNAQINEVIELLDHKLSNVAVSVKLDYSIPAIAIATVSMKQVLMNLIKNAAEAISNKGELLITTSEAYGMVIIQIKDTGSGILSKHKDEIYKTNFSTKGKEHANSGVGLSAVKAIVLDAQGSIKVASKAREEERPWSVGFEQREKLRLGPSGTIFQIELPAVRSVS